MNSFCKSHKHAEWLIAAVSSYLTFVLFWTLTFISQQQNNNKQQRKYRKQLWTFPEKFFLHLHFTPTTSLRLRLMTERLLTRYMCYILFQCLFYSIRLP